MIDSIPGLVCRKVQCPRCRRASEPRVDRIIFQWAAASRQPPAASQASLPFITSDRRHRKRGLLTACRNPPARSQGAKVSLVWCPGSWVTLWSHLRLLVTVCDFKAAAPNPVASCVDHLDFHHLSFIRQAKILKAVNFIVEVSYVFGKIISDVDIFNYFLLEN